MRAYTEHRRVCADVGIEPAAFGTFIVEWLEVEAQPKEDATRAGVDDGYFRRNYDRMFEGQKGWD